MSYSILNIGSDTRKQALSGLRDVANREQEIEHANKQIKTAERTQTMSAAGTGAMIGAMTPLGPVGAVIGGVGGLIIGELF